MKKNLKFGEAVELAKNGALITRAGWNGKSMFVFMRPADKLSVDFIVEKVKSLPPGFKEWADKMRVGPHDILEIEFLPYLCMKTADNKVVNGWLASQTDILSEDWSEYEIPTPLNLPGCPFNYCDSNPRCEGRCRYAKS